MSIFSPQTLQHLELITMEEGTSPICDIVIDDLFDSSEGTTKQIYAACGQGRHSSVRILKHGLSVQDIAETQIPGVPTDIFTVKLKPEDEYDSYVVVSFVNATIVLSIGDGVEEVFDSGFMTNEPTLACGLLGILYHI